MTVTIDNKALTVPQSWNELPLRQQLICYAIIMSDTPRLFDASEVVTSKKIQLIQALLNVDDAYMQKWAKDCHEVHGEDGANIFLNELNEVMQIVDFLFHTEDDETKSIALTLTKCPYPYLIAGKHKGRKVKWFAPKDGLSNLSLYELGYTFTIFEQYIKSTDEIEQNELAYKLLATIYRPQKEATKENLRSGYKGDIRLPLRDHESMIDKRIKKIKQMPSLPAQLIMFWFASCRQQIINTYTNVFQEGSTKEEADKYGWSAVLLNLADGIVHLDAVADRNFSDAMTYLSYLEDQRQKSQLIKH